MVILGPGKLHWLVTHGNSASYRWCWRTLGTAITAQALIVFLFISRHFLFQLVHRAGLLLYLAILSTTTTTTKKTLNKEYTEKTQAIQTTNLSEAQTYHTKTDR